MSLVSPENLLLVGKVIRPHGLGGHFKIYSYAQSEESFLKAGYIFLKSDPEEFHEYKIISVKPLKNIFLMKLEGVDSLEEAEKISASSASLPIGIIR